MSLCSYVIIIYKSLSVFVRPAHPQLVDFLITTRHFTS